MPQRISHYFQPFDPGPLLNSMERCFDGGATGVDNMSLYCVGDKRDLDAFAAANGLPELGSDVFSGISVHFNYTSLNSPQWYDRNECFITYDRHQATDPRYFAWVAEPCDADKERYGDEGWPADESAGLTIQDRTRGVTGKDGDELFPQLRIYGFNSNESIDTLLDFYGVAP